MPDLPLFLDLTVPITNTIRATFSVPGGSFYDCQPGDVIAGYRVKDVKQTNTDRKVITFQKGQDTCRK